MSACKYNFKGYIYLFVYLKMLKEVNLLWTIRSRIGEKIRFKF